MNSDKLWYYNYEVEYYDDIVDKKVKKYRAKGIVAANNYKEAIDTITWQYGDEQIVSVKIEVSDHEGVYEQEEVEVIE